MTTIDCTGLRSAKVLASLYNNARPLGYGMQAFNPSPMEEKEALALLDKNTYFDYVKGRPLKLSFVEYPKLDTWLYDRDQGTGKAREVIDELRKQSE